MAATVPSIFAFAPDEVFSEEKLTDMSVKEFLQLRTGLYKVADVEKLFDLNPGTLRNLALKLQRRGESPYQKWGIGNSTISHWVVRAKIFCPAWDKEIKHHVQPAKISTIPDDISSEELVALEGVYRLSELRGRFPFLDTSIKNQARKYDTKSREIMGCWKSGSHFYVDMQPFLKWLADHQYQ
jgi:hypothetical protein